MNVANLALMVVALSFSIDQANAITVLEYEGSKNNHPAWVEAHINGVGQGMGWSNAVVESRLKEKLFCPPQNIALNAENYLSIIDKEIESGRWKDQDPVELVLFMGLEKTFPCD